MRLFEALVVVFVSTMLIIHRLRPVAVRVGLLDHPCSRKRHEASIPVIGGLGIYVGFLLGIVVLAPAFKPMLWLVLGSLVLLLVGTLDDYSGVRPLKRFAVQSMAALLPVVGADLRIVDLGQLFPGLPPVELHHWSMAFTVFSVVGITNAMNLIDGMDGLAGMLVGVTLMMLTIATGLAGQWVLCQLSMLLLMAVVGFLYFNWPQKVSRECRVFLGDGGSTLLGYWLAFLLIAASQGPARAIAPVVAPWLIAVPILDTLTVMICRVLQGRSPFYADRTHIHHLMQSAGLSPKLTLYAIGGQSVACAGVAMIAAANQVPESSLVMFFVMFSVAYLLWYRYAWAARSFFGREVCRRHQSRRRMGQDRRQAPAVAFFYAGSERRQAERRIGQRRAGVAPQPSLDLEPANGMSDG